MRRGVRSIQAAALLLVLGLHLASRLAAAAQTPLSFRTFYPRDYEVALSLMSGGGFRGLGVWSDPRPEAYRVRQFLRMVRNDVREKNWRPLVAGARMSEPPTLSTSRVLDMYVAAGLWRLFGVRWSVLFTFYSVLSTVVALLIFLIARRLGGSFWAGLLAAIFYTASPFETLWSTAGIRDVSPLWFDTVALAALLLLRPLSGSPPLRVACALVAGTCATLGIGWRTDGWMAPPMVLVGLLVLLGSERRSLGEAAASIGSFLAGVTLVGAAMAAAGPGSPLSPQIGFHIAYYGNENRCNMLGIENSFLAIRNDFHAWQQAAYYALVTRGTKDLPYGIGEYGSACRHLYLQTLAHNVFNWLAGFPRFFVNALGGLGAPETLQGVGPPLLELCRLDWMGPVYRSVLDPLTRMLPALFLFGSAVLLVVGPERAEAALMVGFALAYGAALLMVLPESKHFGPMLLPLCTVAGAGLWRAGTLALSASTRKEAVRTVREQVLTRSCAKLVLGTGAVVLLLAAVAATVSSVARRGYLSEIERLAENGTSARETVLGPRLSSFTIRPGDLPDPRGYLLTIRAGARPSVLVCHHRRGIGAEETQRLYLTRHRLAPARTQYFFVTGLQGAFRRDLRTYVCTVTIEGDAEIVDSRWLDLSSWRRPVYATVFGGGGWWPGSPRVGDAISTEGFGVPSVDVDERGLSLREREEEAAPAQEGPPPESGEKAGSADRSISSGDPTRGLERSMLTHSEKGVVSPATQAGRR